MLLLLMLLLLMLLLMMLVLFRRQGRGYPFICTYCRVHVSPTSSPSHQRTPTAHRSTICTTSERRRPDAKDNEGPAPSFPGRFAAGHGFAGGSFGSLAAAKKPHETTSSVEDTLLPHEQEARKKAGPASAGSSFGSFASAKKPHQTTRSLEDTLLPHELLARRKAVKIERMTASTPHQKKKSRFARSTDPARAPQHKSRFREGNEAQFDKCKSVLANVFKPLAEPQRPVAARPTPAGSPSSSSSSSNPSSASTSSAPDGKVNILSSPFSAGKAYTFPSSTTSRDEPTRNPPPPGGAPRQVGWGTFSHRKGQNDENDSSVRRNNTPTDGARGTFHDRFKGRSTGANPATAASSTTEAASGTKDFWGELDTRVADLKESRGKDTGGRREALAADGSARRNSDMITGEGADTASQDAPGKGNRHNERRKSRFEFEDETEETNERRSKKSKKSSSRRRMEDDDWHDESIHRWEHKQRRKAEKEAQRQKELQEEQPAVSIFLPEYISASNLARALKQRPDQFLADMEEMGFENVTPDTIMTGETAALISMEYGFEPTVDTGSQRDLRARPVPEDVSSLPGRPPVVTIMGHVDHGKTTLLDWLRKSSVAAQEHGGITQHIGAFVVKMSTGKQITFLDTPGHAAFLSMRQRGANVTDIVVLVVAADDSVMPQTVEALKHATSAKVPIIVAINKIDKEDARVDQVKADLARHGVEIEDYGGDVQVVCVSGKTGQGMADLEENIITLSEILDVRAETDGMAEGWILESSVKQNGKAATILVKRGTLRPGDLVVAGKTWARIRVIRNEAGKEVAEAPPGSPVEILGWRELPEAGAEVLQAPDEARAKTAVEYRLEMAGREESS
ncbi:hypothetical protein E4U41_001127, partial [Claviceps citrina]